MHPTKTTTTKKKSGPVVEGPATNRCSDTAKGEAAPLRVKRGSNKQKRGKALGESQRGNLKLLTDAREHTAPAWGRGRASKPGSRLGLRPRPVAGGHPTGRERSREDLLSSHSGSPARRCLLRAQHLSPYSCQEKTNTEWRYRVVRQR